MLGVAWAHEVSHSGKSLVGWIMQIESVCEAGVGFQILSSKHAKVRAGFLGRQCARWMNRAMPSWALDFVDSLSPHTSTSLSL